MSFFTRTTSQSPRLRETLAVVAIRRGNSRSMFLFVGGESYGGDHLYYEYRQCRAICQDPGAGNRTSCIFNERGTKKIRPGADVICLGWIMAGTIKGYSASVRHYQVQAVCAVGMGRTGTQTDAVRKKNCIPGECPLFTIQGNFDVNKLHGMYRMMMELMIRTAGKALAGKKDRTAEEDDMLDMMLRGGERVRRENLMEVLEWYHLQEHI